MLIERREKFELFLAAFVFLLTIIGSIISGYTVYKLTTTEYPLLFISLYGNNNSKNLNLTISNYRETPANNILITYKIEQLSNEEHLFEEIPDLFKGSANFDFSIAVIEQTIRPNIEVYLNNLNHPNEQNYSFYVRPYPGLDNVAFIDGQYVLSTRPEYYTIEFSVTCKNCRSEDIIFTNNPLKIKVGWNCDRIKMGYECESVPVKNYPLLND